MRNRTLRMARPPRAARRFNHYLAVAGVDQASITLHAPDLPPTDVLLDIHSAADAGALPDQAAVNDAALAAVPVEVPHQPQDDPQHHGA